MNSQETKISSDLCKHEHFNRIKARPEGALSNLVKWSVSLPRADGGRIR